MACSTRLHVVLAAVVLVGCGGASASSSTTAASVARSDVRAARLERLDDGRLVDLTHPFDAQTLYWPTSPSGFVLENLHHGLTPKGFFYAANRFSAPEHGGTHLDAPIHFAEGHPGADALPLERLIAPAVVIDIRAAAAKNVDALLGASDLRAFEAAHGAIAAGTIVLVRTGWADRWPDRRSYFGDEHPGDAAHLHFPGVDEAAARLLVERRVAAGGIDTPSIVYGPSQDFVAHRVLLGADVAVFENVASMSDLPARGAIVIALPMKIRGGSGAPLRIVAVVPR
jgi:kynurenine formamidase